MNEIVPSPPDIVHNEQQAVLGLFQKYVVPSYGRFELVRHPRLRLATSQALAANSG